MLTLSLLLASSLATFQPAEDPPRLRAAEVLSEALVVSQRDEPSASTLERAVAEARRFLGADSELAEELEKQVAAARVQGFLEGVDGAAWLAERLPAFVDDLRFEPTLEADLPAGFPGTTPVREIELKSYPRYRLARTEMGGGRSGGAFWTLFQHISRNEIAMTAPVETTFAASDRSTDARAMAFLYASTDLGAPGSEGRVDVVDVEPMRVLSLGLRGRDDASAIDDARERLDRWLRTHPEWRASGELRTMGYNSPMVRGSRRFFEVQLPVTRTTTDVIDFEDREEVARWQPVDDVVMGGRSASRVEREAGGATVFQGVVSLENNGGFASVRTSGERCALGESTELVLRVRGDGKTYGLRLRTSSEFGAPSWQTSFETRAGEWQDVVLPLATFELKWRGRPITDSPPLDPARVVGLGLAIADEQAGPFRLELESLLRR